MFQNLINIIASPKEVFVALKEKRSALFPLLIIIIFSAGMQALYFSKVDKDFYIDETIEQTMKLISMVPEAELRRGMEDTSLMTSGISAAVSIAIILPIIFAFFALYLSFISKFSSDGIKFKQWFSLAVWTSIPLIFSAIAASASILLNTDGLITQNSLKPLSLNNLIFQSTGAYQSMLSNISIDQLWATVLIILGYQNWTGKSLTTSCIVNLAPYVLIYGIWALIITL